MRKGRLLPFLFPGVGRKIRRTLALGVVGFLAVAGAGPMMAWASDGVAVGSKNFPESAILGEIAAKIVEKTEGIPVDRRLGLGGTGIAYQALINGEIDLYPEYTGTLTHAILKDPRFDTPNKLRKAFEPLGLRITKPLGFNNTYAFAVPEAVAQRLRLETISDLRKHPDIPAAFSYEFMNREDGFHKLSRRYRLALNSVKPMEHSLAYQAIKDGTVQLIDVYSTDAKLDELHLFVLEDDKGFFPRYDGVYLARTAFVEGHPRAWAALKELEGQLSDELMIRLNALADSEGKSYSEVADIYLSSRQWADLSKRKESFHLEPPPGKFKGYVRQTRTFWRHLWRLTLEHSFLVGISLLFSILVGLPLGITARRIPVLGQGVLLTAGLLQTIPSLALLCFLIPFFGIGTEPALVALFLYGLLPIVRNTYAGLEGIEPKYRETASALGLSDWQRLRHVELPLSSISIMAGIKTSAVINVGTATLAALIGAGGYGTLIVTGLALNDLQMILQGALPAALMAIVIHMGFEALDSVFIPKGLKV